MRPSLPRLQPISTVRSRSLWRNAGLCARPVNYRLVQLGRLVHYKFRSVQFVGCERGLTQKNRRPSFCCTSRLVVHCLMSQVRRLILMSRQWTMDKRLTANIRYSVCNRDLYDTGTQLCRRPTRVS